jgi:hypothetical protein
VSNVLNGDKCVTVEVTSEGKPEGEILNDLSKDQIMSDTSESVSREVSWV